MRNTTALAVRFGCLTLSILAMVACDPGEVLSVTFTEGDVTLVVGETRRLPLHVETTGDARKTVSWSVGDPSVAKLQRSRTSLIAGVVALSEGVTQVTATSSIDRTKSDTVTITVLSVEDDATNVMPQGR